MTEPDPDGPVNPDAPELDLDVPVPGSPSETTRDETAPDDDATHADADDSPEPPD